MRSVGLTLLLAVAGCHEPREPGTPDYVAAGMERELQAQQVWLSTLSSNSVQVVSERSGHFIQGQNPKLVIASVRQVVEAVRTHGRVDASALSALAHEAPSEP